MGKTFEAIKKAEKEQGINYLSTNRENLLQGDLGFKKAYRRQRQIELFKGKPESYGYSRDGKHISIADYYKVLRSRIKKRIEDENIRSILITSAVEGEGKSFTALNLAISFAMLPNKNVFLIEANLRKPILGSLFALPPGSMGWIDYLQDNISLKELMIDPGIPNLKIVPAGILIPEATELLNTDKMGEMIGSLSQSHDDCIILFDGSSLLSFPDNSILMEAVQSVLLVLKAEKTPIAKLKEAYERIEGHNLIGVVLNMAKDNA